MSYRLIIVLALGLAACDRATPENTAPAAPPPAVVTAVPADTTLQRGYYADIDQATFKRFMKRENTVLLDVRTPPEIANGNLPGSLEIDYKAADFTERIRALDTTKTYLIYCRSGNRSGKACAAMAEMGFDTLYNLEGGYMAWK